LRNGARAAPAIAADTAATSSLNKVVGRRRTGSPATTTAATATRWYACHGEHVVITESSVPGDRNRATATRPPNNLPAVGAVYDRAFLEGQH